MNTLWLSDQYLGAGLVDSRVYGKTGYAADRGIDYRNRLRKNGIESGWEAGTVPLWSVG